MKGAKGSKAYSILGFRVPTTSVGTKGSKAYSILGFRVLNTSVGERGEGEQRRAKGVKGAKGGKGEQRGSKGGAKGSKAYSILGFRVPTTCGKTKISITTYSGEVSPPPANRTTIPYTFTEPQKAFVGPHHGPKILGQKQPIDH